MSIDWAFHCLQLAPDADPRTIRRRYGELLKLNRPEDNPQGFQQLRAAYEICLAFARDCAQEREPRAEQVDAVAMPVQNDAEQHASTPHDARLPDDIAAASSDSANAAAPAQHDNSISAADVHSVEFAPRPRHLKTFIEVDNFSGNALARTAPVRATAAVVDELLRADAQDDANAVASWLVQCPEVLSLVTRDAVELALLQRIADGTRLSVRSLEVLGATFGWRQLGFERRLLRQGLAPEQLNTLLQGLGRARAEAEFAAHLAAGKALGNTGSWNYGADVQLRQLRRLHARRADVPHFAQALIPGRVDQAYRLIQLYAKRYGASSALHVFGREATAFWASLHPENGINRRLYWLRLGQVSLVVLLLYLVLPLAYLFPGPLSTAQKLAALGQWSEAWLLQIWPIVLAAVTAHALLRCYGQSRERLNYLKQQALRALLPWLAPRRALPLQLALAPLLIASGHYVSVAIPFVLGLALCSLFGVVALGFALVGGIAIGAALFAHWPWPDSNTFIPAMVCICLLIAWAVDWLGGTGAVRQQAKQDAQWQQPSR